MKIAFVVHDYHRSGGHSRYVAELAVRFSREHEVHVFANTFPAEDGTNIHFHRVPAWRRSALTSILSFPLAAAVRVKGDFDIIHSQGLCCFRFNVLTAHICNRAWLKVRKEKKLAVSRKEKLADVVFDELLSPLEAWQYRLYRKASVIAISDLTKRHLAECYGRTERVTVIHHGVDGELFHPRNRARYRAEVRRELRVGETEFLALFVGQLMKGAATAIKSFQHLAAGKLLLVSPTNAEPYRRLAQQLGIGDRVLFHSHTDVIERFYTAADAFVFPSPYDAFGMVIAEAMSAGLPVVTSRAAGAAELIAHREEGFLLDDPADDEEVARYLKRLIGDPAMRQSMGAAARRKMERQTWDEVARRTMEVYRQVLNDMPEPLLQRGSGV